jgi:hypothetical protein
MTLRRFRSKALHRPEAFGRFFGHRRTRWIAKDLEATVTLPIGTKQRIDAINHTRNVGETQGVITLLCHS